MKKLKKSSKKDNFFLKKYDNFSPPTLYNSLLTIKNKIKLKTDMIKNIFN